MVTAGREVGRHWRQIRVRPHVQNQIHADQYVEQEVTVEQPVSYGHRIIVRMINRDIESTGNNKLANPRVRLEARQIDRPLRR